MSDQEEIIIDLSGLREIAGDDDMFVAAILGKMVKGLPECFTRMRNSCDAQDWPELKASSHKAKGTFAYLDIQTMKERLKSIEHDAYDGVNLEQLPEKVTEAIALGERYLAKLKEEMMKLM